MDSIQTIRCSVFFSPLFFRKSFSMMGNKEWQKLNISIKNCYYNLCNSFRPWTTTHKKNVLKRNNKYEWLLAYVNRIKTSERWIWGNSSWLVWMITESNTSLFTVHCSMIIIIIYLWRKIFDSWHSLFLFVDSSVCASNCMQCAQYTSMK